MKGKGQKRGAPAVGEEAEVSDAHETFGKHVQQEAAQEFIERKSQQFLFGLAGAFRNIGRAQIADEILKTMAAAGYGARESDPFADKPALVFAARETSPYVNRIRLLWEKMREPIIERFPKAPGLPKNIDAYMKRVDDAYVTDAYHSLSIEGYRVTRDLIERVRTGTWNPEANEGDREQRNAMAARGYWLAYQAVQKSLEKILNGENPGEVADEDHGT